MADLKKLTHNLKSRGYTVRYFDTVDQATDYLDGQIDKKSVAFGGSVTLRDMDLYPKLSSHNQVIWHWEGGDLKQAMGADVYITSANAVAETGEIINIDGTGNRVAAISYGPDCVYIVAGINKIAPDYDSALWRARNIAAPKNAQRLGFQTPCAIKADRCYDCKSPQRVCRILNVLWGKPMKLHTMEIILVGQELGY